MRVVVHRGLDTRERSDNIEVMHCTQEVVVGRFATVLLSILFLLAGTGIQAEFFPDTPFHGEQGVDCEDLRSHSPSPAESLVADWVFDADAPVLSALNVADVDGDSVADILLTTYGQGPNPYAAGHIHVMDMSGNTLPGWPKQTGAPFAASCVAGDVDGDGAFELVSGDWSVAYIWEGDGTPLPGWPRSPGAYVAPALGDMDKDGEMEIVYSGTDNRLYLWHEDGSLMPGWPFAAPALIGSPVIADIDNDDTLEIVAATYQGPVGPDSFEVYAWEADGSVIGGFPVWTSGVNKSAPAIGDIDLDGDQEIIVISYHTSNLDFIYAFGPGGVLEPGWPVRAEYVRLSSPALGDIDGDGDLEILCGGYDAAATTEKMYAYHHGGTPVAGWPVVLDHPGASGNINSSAIVADLDGIHSSYDTFWPIYKHDPAGTGAFPRGGITYNEPEVLVKVVDHIFALRPDGSTVEGFPFFLDDESHTGTHSPSPALADMDLDGDAELVCVSSSGILMFLDMEPAGSAEDISRGRASAGPGLEIAPNPFSVYTEIRVAEGSAVQIFDAAGRRIDVSLWNRVKWYGEDKSGAELPDGIYFAVAWYEGRTETAKIVMLR